MNNLWILAQSAGEEAPSGITSAPVTSEEAETTAVVASDPNAPTTRKEAPGFFSSPMLLLGSMFYDEEREKKKDRKTQTLETPISDFELSVRSRNCFKKMNIKTLGDLMNITEVELLSYKNFGETSLREIKAILESKGLYLGMALKEKQLSSAEFADRSLAEDEDKELLNKPIDDIRLSVRAQKCLRKLNIHTLSDLIQRTDAELLGCKNFGITSLNEIKKAIGKLGLSLRALD